jgi:hypothetical protein
MTKNEAQIGTPHTVNNRDKDVLIDTCTELALSHC